MRAQTVGLLAAALLLGAGCDKKVVVEGGCELDSDCGDVALFKCNVRGGDCRCKADQACAAGESCNALGFCQKKIGCANNLDCPSDYFCDIASAQCLKTSLCTSDSQCAFGEYCNPSFGRCSAGCRSSGDCVLGQVCYCESREGGTITEETCACDGVTDAERAACAVGKCVEGSCEDSSYCGWGQYCREPPEGGRKRCVDAWTQETPFCDGCDSYARDACGEGPNFCLYSTYNQIDYCGVHCRLGYPDECPNGYDCSNVVVFWSNTKCVPPSVGGGLYQCALHPSLPCQEDADCPIDGLCDPVAKQCRARCVERENANEGICACIVDNDCAQDACVAGYCSNTKKRCDSSKPCTTVRCVDLGDHGGCVIGANCKPYTGLTCQELRGEQ